MAAWLGDSARDGARPCAPATRQASSATFAVTQMRQVYIVSHTMPCVPRRQPRLSASGRFKLVATDDQSDLKDACGLFGRDSTGSALVLSRDATSCNTRSALSVTVANCAGAGAPWPAPHVAAVPRGRSCFQRSMV